MLQTKNDQSLFRETSYTKGNADFCLFSASCAFFAYFSYRQPCVHLPDYILIQAASFLL